MSESNKIPVYFIKICKCCWEKLYFDSIESVEKAMSNLSLGPSSVEITDDRGVTKSIDPFYGYSMDEEEMRDVGLGDLYDEIKRKEKGLTDGEQRLFFAHQVGHILRKHEELQESSDGTWDFSHRDHQICLDVSESYIDSQANRFARNFLLPRPKVRSVIRHIGRNVKKISEAFAVPERLVRHQFDCL